MHKLNDRSVATFGIPQTKRRVLETLESEVEIDDLKQIHSNKPALTNQRQGEHLFFDRKVESLKSFIRWNGLDFFFDYGPEMYNLLSTEKVRARQRMKTFYSYLNVVVSQYQHYDDCKHSVRNDTNEEPKQTREKNTQLITLSFITCDTFTQRTQTPHTKIYCCSNDNSLVVIKVLCRCFGETWIQVFRNLFHSKSLVQSQCFIH